MSEFKNSSDMKVSIKVNLDLDGYIAQPGDDIGGQKAMTINGIKKNATLTECNQVFNTFYGTIGQATFDSLSAIRTITEGVG